MQAGKGSIKSDRQGEAAYQTLHIRRAFFLPEPDEAVAYFHSHREVDLVHMLGVAFINNNMRGNNRAEVEQDQPGPDFLLNVDDFFRDKIGSADGVF